MVDPILGVLQVVIVGDQVETQIAEEEVVVVAEDLLVEELVSNVAKKATCRVNVPKVVVGEEEEAAAVDLVEAVHVSSVAKKAICLVNVLTETPAEVHLGRSHP